MTTLSFKCDLESGEATLTVAGENAIDVLEAHDDLLVLDILRDVLDAVVPLYNERFERFYSGARFNDLLHTKAEGTA